MSSSDDSSHDPELLEIVNQYRTAVKIEENTYNERLNKETEDFATMWYTAFPEQLNEPAYLAQQKRLHLLRNWIHDIFEYVQRCSHLLMQDVPW